MVYNKGNIKTSLFGISVGLKIPLYRVNNIDDYVLIRDNIYLICHVELAPWAEKKLNCLEGGNYIFCFKEFIRHVTDPYERFLERSFEYQKPKYPAEHHSPYYVAYDQTIMKLEWQLNRGDSIKKLRQLSKTLSQPKSRFGRKVWSRMFGLNEQLADAFRLYDKARPSFRMHKNLIDTANKMSRQVVKIDNAFAATKALLEKIEERNTSTQAMLAKAEQITSDLGDQFDKIRAYNEEVIANLQAMSAVLEAKDSFMNQPTQVVQADKNIAEMLKLLTALTKDENKE